MEAWKRKIENLILCFQKKMVKFMPNLKARTYKISKNGKIKLYKYNTINKIML